MARRVFKYPITVGDGVFSISMPRGAKVLHIHPQGLDVFLWAMVDSAAPMTLRHFCVVATGEAIPKGLRYVGTFHVGTAGDPRVWHVFE